MSWVPPPNTIWLVVGSRLAFKTCLSVRRPFKLLELWVGMPLRRPGWAMLCAALSASHLRLHVMPSPTYLLHGLVVST